MKCRTWTRSRTRCSISMRAVFEYHPENLASINVLLSQLGTFQYKKKYPNGAPNQEPNNEAALCCFVRQVSAWEASS